MKRAVFLLTVLVVILGALSACAPTDTLQKTYFRRQDNYTTVAEVAGLMDSLSTDKADLSKDQAIELALRWASAKYLTSTATQSGYDEKPRLVIGYGSVGVLQVGAYQLILPPRMYANLPQGDDELQVKEALCVAPNMIAWRYDYNSKLELKLANPECYLLPKEGWNIVESLRVDQGQTAYRMQENGAFEFRGPTPGTYPSEIKATWVVTQAVQIAPNEFGVYTNPDGTLQALATGIHYQAVPQFVQKYRTDEMRYRTLAVEVYNEDRSPKSAACSSELCGTIIDKIVVSGTQRLAAFNVDVGFKAEPPFGKEEVLVKYRNLGSMSAAIVDYIEGPTRESVRSVGANMTQPMLESETGKIEFENRVMKRVQGILDQKGVPLKLTYVNVRSRNFNDADLRSAASQAEVELQRENARVAAAEARAKAIQAETQAQEALQHQIALKLESVAKVVSVTDGISCTELTLVASLGLIDPLDWAKLPKEMCINGGNMSVDVTVPAP